LGSVVHVSACEETTQEIVVCFYPIADHCCCYHEIDYADTARMKPNKSRQNDAGASPVSSSPQEPGASALWRWEPEKCLR